MTVRGRDSEVTARGRGTRKGKRADDAEERALLELLTHGLSEDEIRRVVACALLVLDERGRDRLVARLGEETGGTLRRLLVSLGRSGTKARPSPCGIEATSMRRRSASSIAGERSPRDLTRKDAVLEAFRRVPSARFAGIRDRLFADWRSLVVETTLERRADGHEAPGSAWVRALVDAARAGGDGAPSFRRAVRQWLEETGRTPAALRQSLHALGTLTLDLDLGSALRRTSPTLHRLLSRRSEGDHPFKPSRRRWVEGLGVADLFPEVIEFWKRQAAGLVPDPANAVGSKYDECAEWLAAVFELDAVAYQRVVRGWAVSHARRKNLWLAITRRQLPL
jgi:hypothetical protein